jgi:AcrR family transcriptional regulator
MTASAVLDRGVVSLPAVRATSSRAPMPPPVAEFQRARILEAMVVTAEDHGIQRTTVARIIRRAGVSRRTFYDLFSDRHDCFLAVFEDAVSRGREQVAAAIGADERWHERVRLGLHAILRLMDEQPGRARLCVFDAPSAGPEVLARRSEVLRSLAAFVDLGGERARTQPSPLTAEGLVGGALAVLHERLLNDPHAPLLDLLNPLTAMIVMPYLGGAAARRQLSRQPPRPAPRPGVAPPHDGFNLRVTYRTLRVLVAIEAEPGISNRQVGVASGIADQGQVSKLLARLRKLGLIENTGEGPSRGQANAWHLTRQGHSLKETVGDWALRA